MLTLPDIDKIRIKYFVLASNLLASLPKEEEREWQGIKLVVNVGLCLKVTIIGSL